MHGLYPEEKLIGGIFKVDLWVDEEVPDDKDFHKLANLINYEQLYSIVKEEMFIKRDFIEDLAKSILQRTSNLLNNKDVLITVKITKMDPAKKFGSGSASVTLKG